MSSNRVVNKWNLKVISTCCKETEHNVISTCCKEMESQGYFYVL